MTRRGEDDSADAYSRRVAILLAPVLVAVVVVSFAAWVYADARRWVGAGTPVVFHLGALHITTPEAWAVACLFLFAFFAPAYVLARRD